MSKTADDSGMSLSGLGWRSFFASQVPPNAAALPARVFNVQRGRLGVVGEHLDRSVALSGTAAALDVTVGDWVWLDPDGERVLARLDRLSRIRRGAAGGAGEVQDVAANIDTLFVVTSANRDFKPARLERYLALASQGGVAPVVVITRADLVADVDVYRREAAALKPGLLVEALDARDPDSAGSLLAYCGPGQTVALVGSSGVGKSTLINTLTSSAQTTRSARAGDDRGRHTTTSRSMHALPSGGWLIDTPGMRELRLVESREGIQTVFGEIDEFARSCRFADCEHAGEPGCAVAAAIESGALDARRLSSYRKLLAEDRRHSESLAARHARERAQGKLYKAIVARQRKAKGEDGAR